MSSSDLPGFESVSSGHPRTRKLNLMTDPSKPDLLGLTTNIVSSHVSNNAVATADLPNLIQNVYSSLARLGAPAAAAPTRQEPAVSVRASIKPDHLVCLEDGRKVKMLKRYLM